MTKYINGQYLEEMNYHYHWVSVGISKCVKILKFTRSGAAAKS